MRRMSTTADQQQLAEALRESLKTTERLRRENRRLASQSNDPIAIIGMGCRYPGGVHNPRELWDLVMDETDAVSEFPSDRGWGDIDKLFHPDPDHARTTYTREGGFIDEVAKFDAPFFSIGPREAVAMDPQQRLLLEVSWEAVEHARIDPLSLRGSTTGVFAGIAASAYGLQINIPEELEGLMVTGTTTSVASGRIAYLLGLEGPTMSIDTACSSSLVALHLACQALRKGECRMALAGGATVFANPGLFISFARLRGLAPDGRCKSFASSADGVGWAEGAGMLALERFADAERTGHRVLAVVRGTATNQDGASNGMSAPSGGAQERVIRAAVEDAGLTLADIEAVEAHGTGTPIGDPIEAHALLETYGQERRNGPVKVGSLKSNIGHSVAAAGVGGVIKTVLAMREGRLPRTLHIEKPTPHVEWSIGDVELLTESQPWPRGDRPRRAGVSSFGISGTNTHAVLEEAAPEPEPAASNGKPAEEAKGPVPLPFLLAAKSENSLQGQAQQLHTHLIDNPQLGAADVAYSLATTRPQLEHRAVILAPDRERLLQMLDVLRAGASGGGVVQGEVGVGKTAFQFTGQGAQRPGMGSDLYRSFPAFATALDAVCAELDRELGRSLKDLMFAAAGSPEAELLDATEFAQPALFALEVSLFRLLESLGVRPDLLIGHSIGELVAAHVAGVLSLPDAAKLVAARGRLMGALPPGGAMLAVEASEEEVAASLAGLAGDAAEEPDGDAEEPGDPGATIAGINGPLATVVSGEAEAVERFAELWQQRGRRTFHLRVSHAFHSPLMEPMLEELEEVARSLDFQPPQIPIVSNVSGQIAGDELTTPEYWSTQVRSPVRFRDGIAALEAAGVRRFLELGPEGVLSALAYLSLSPEIHSQVLVAPTMRDQRGEEETLMEFLATIHAGGVPVDWRAFFDGSGARQVDLPTYAFDRQWYWLEYREGIGDIGLLGQAPAEHPLLPAAVRLADEKGWVFTGRLSLEEQPWLADHAVMGVALLPGTGFVELALAAATQVGAAAIEELNFEAPLLLADDAPVQVQVVVEEPEEGTERRIGIYSRPQGSNGSDGPWMRNASGSLRVGAPETAEGGLGQEPWPPEEAEPVETEFLYDRLAEAGYDYGPVFQGVHAAWRRGDELYAEVGLDDQQARKADQYCIHPALADASLHVALQLALAAEEGKLVVPFSLRGLRFGRKGASSLRVRLTQGEEGNLRIEAVDFEGSPVLDIEALVARPISASALQASQDAVHESLYRVEWIPVWTSLPTETSLRCATLGDLELPGVEERHADIEVLAGTVEDGAPAPELVLVEIPGCDKPGALAPAAHAAVHRALQLVKTFVAAKPLSNARLGILSRGAAKAMEGEAPDPAAAAALGLLRSAQSEHPGRLLLLDLDPAAPEPEADWLALTVSEETQLAVRNGIVYGPRLAQVLNRGVLVPPDEPAWHLASEGRGTLEDLGLRPIPQVEERLGHGEVRVSVRVGGLNFRDVLLVLNQYPGKAAVGGEGAGVITEVGPGVEDFAIGDRVLGVMSHVFGPTARADQRGLVHLPPDWTFVQGASVPFAFLTASYGLFDLASLRPGERVLIHAGAGGVGMAAVQLAKHLGAEVFATASPGKWRVLEALGIDADHLASSRDLEFREKFLAATDGNGVDVVLNALAGEFVDASLDLLPSGGRFVEMGKTDIRDAEALGATHPGVTYMAFDLFEAGLDRATAILKEMVRLLDEELSPLPIAAWDVRHGIDAFRYLRDGRNVGKVVLTIPRPLDPEGTVLVTGGTGALGALMARHLVSEQGVRHLVLTSRRGPEAEGAEELQEELAAGGCEARVVACDVADRAALEKVLAEIPDDRPLTGVVHAAGVLADATVETLDDEQVETVLRPKVDAAAHLHELTEHLDLSMFALFSSGAATLGNPGQGNYSAANSFLDALAQRRRVAGLPAQSLAWGLWDQEAGTGMGGDLDEAARARLARIGIVPLGEEEGLELFDVTLGTDEAMVVPVHLDLTVLRKFARAGILPPLLRRLVRAPMRRERSGGRSLARRLAGVPEEEWKDVVLQSLRTEVAVVLGYESAEAIDPKVEFKDLGFDSLAAVELYNRLCLTTGLRLPTTMGFDYPTPETMTDFLCDQMRGDGKTTTAKEAPAENGAAAKGTAKKAAPKKGAAKKASPKKATAKKSATKKGTAKKGTAKKAGAGKAAAKKPGTGKDAAAEKDAARKPSD
jgi:acyl transferase domain-containing protein/NADPH:quinone reductase-like Zn-dependent oxidoreductase/acyl carrier protein